MQTSMYKAFCFVRASPFTYKNLCVIRPQVPKIIAQEVLRLLLEVLGVTLVLVWFFHFSGPSVPSGPSGDTGEPGLYRHLPGPYKDLIRTL